MVLFSNLIRNLSASLRLIACLPVRAEAFVIRTDQLILLLSLSIGLRLFGSSIPYWPVTGVWAYGSGLLLLRFVLVLAVLQAVAWLYSQWREAGALQIMVLGGALLADIAWFVVANTVSWSALPLYAGFLIPTAFLGFWALATMRAMQLVLGAGWVTSALAGAGLAAGLLLLGLTLNGAPIFQTG